MTRIRTRPSEHPVDRGRLVYRWDLDKTYLRTEFDTMRDLVRTALEPAARKRTVPGASALLRELRATGPAGIFILSGSPEQMRRALEAKLRLDGVIWDSFTLKPSLGNLLRGRFRFLRDQVGYKLGALLGSRSTVPPETNEVLFGDDAEADAFIYSLYADICAGRVESAKLMEILEAARVYREDIGGLVRLAERAPRRDSCLRIFIHLDRMSDVGGFDEFGDRVVPFYNYLQPALVLLDANAIDGPAVLRVAAELVIEQAFTEESLTESYLDLVRRGHVGALARERLLEAIDEADEARFAGTAPVLRAFAQSLEALPAPPSVAPAGERAEIDYVSLFSRDHARARAAKARVRSGR